MSETTKILKTIIRHLLFVAAPNADTNDPVESPPEEASDLELAESLPEQPEAVEVPFCALHVPTIKCA